MFKLAAKFVRTYLSKKGRIVSVFTLSGTKEAIEAYKAVQGVNYREDEETKAPLFFDTSGTLAENGGEVVVNSTSGKAYVDNGALLRKIAMEQTIARLKGQVASSSAPSGLPFDDSDLGDA